jgi:hypothetical protein
MRAQDHGGRWKRAGLRLSGLGDFTMVYGSGSPSKTGKGTAGLETLARR